MDDSQTARKKHRTGVVFHKLRQKLRGRVGTSPVVLHELKAVLLPIPKVASSSMKQFFADQLGHPRAPTPHLLNFPTVHPRQLVTAPYNSYFKFAFLRNPWERMVSCYAHKIRKDWNINRPYYKRFVFKMLPVQPSDGRTRCFRYPVFHAAMTFQDFIAAVCEIPDQHADIHIQSQSRFITDSSGRLLVDYVGRFEYLQEDFDFVCQRLGLANSQLPHLLKMKHGDYREYYDESTWRAVERRYEADLALLRMNDSHCSPLSSEPTPNVGSV